MALVVPVYILLLYTCSGIHGESIYIPNLPEASYKKLGDFNVGVLLPVHLGEPGYLCGKQIRGLPLLQRLEALVYAVEEINNDSNILPNHTLGYIVFDDCYTDLTALAQSLHFSRTKPPELCLSESRLTCQAPSVNNTPVTIYEVVGVIGSESSITTVQIANLMTAFQIPQLSYLATSPVLSNKAKYPFFQRVVPSDNMQARVVLQLMVRFNWTFIHVMYSEGAYGEGLYQALERTLRDESFARNICFAEPIIIEHDFNESMYDRIIVNMMFDKAANVVLIITPQHEARKILEASKRLNVQGRFTWIATDAWARDILSMGGIEDEALGTISINLDSTAVPRFNSFFKQITGVTRLMNPWVDLFWEHFFNCTQIKRLGLGVCTDNESFVNHLEYNPEATTSLVFDVVKTFALALDNRIRGVCYGLTEEELLSCVKNDFSKELKRTKFLGENGEIVTFDTKGDRMMSFKLYNIQLDGGTNKYKLEPIGKWDHTTQQLHLEQDKIEWSKGVVPFSNCSRPCGVGEGMELQQKRCCWNCVQCAPNQYTRTVNGDVTRCVNCPPGKWPDEETRQTCVDIVPQHVSLQHAIGLALMVLSAVGVTLSVFVCVLYVFNNNHQLIKACSRELSYFMLVGIIVSNVVVLTFVVKPTAAVCFISQVGVVISFTAIYASLAVKTIRIFRLFESGRAMNRKPRCVSWSSQLCICLGITLLHLAVLLVWSQFESPYPDNITSRPGEIDLVCRFPTAPFITGMGVNCLLLLICCVFGFKTRKLPDNFNESRLIAFCVYSNIVLWVACICGYFLTESIFRSLFLALMLIANGFLLLGGLFIPKLYAVYFVAKTELHLRPFGGARLSIVEVNTVSLPEPISPGTQPPQDTGNDSHEEPKVPLPRLVPRCPETGDKVPEPEPPDDNEAGTSTQAKNDEESTQQPKTTLDPVETKDFEVEAKDLEVEAKDLEVLSVNSGTKTESEPTTGKVAKNKIAPLSQSKAAGN